MLIRIQNYSISDLENGIKFLLDRAAHSPEVRQHAVTITYDKEDKISAIYDWIKSSVSYIPDPIGTGGEETELFISPIKQVKDYQQGLRPSGDCDDHALLSCSLFRSIGIKSNVIIIDSIGNGLDHAYSQTYSDKLGKFVSVDTTSDYPLGWELPYKEKIIVD